MQILKNTHIINYGLKWNRAARVPNIFFAISYLSITVITFNWNVLTRELGADTQGCFKSLTKTYTH